MHRIDRLPGGVAQLVDAVADTDIPAVLARLAASVVDACGLDSPEAMEVLTQFRERGAASESALAQLRTAMAALDLEAFVSQRRADRDAQRDNFRRARALDCLQLSAGSLGQAPRALLRDAAYEASAALGGTAGVVAVVADFVA
ncbi:hypothetical protein QSJ18_10355 [Gordonia sp. ABSL1-1]|uniref:hypothetical protein n=1 Tax=Gordonia sp. ABSL1-1 TaxID=3053923 RepID=UPI002572B2AF|nr:hypothetical protein [Gordonia sp. ABSL1-1]MDL9937144.1 hypothetical protein [Gordonia sp. ABSL1-1]